MQPTRRSKRNLTDADIDPSPIAAEDEEDASVPELADGEAADEQPVRKKRKPTGAKTTGGKPRAKKVLKKKVVVWNDLPRWNEGDSPLQKFPLEVLDLIISVDSDLELRDHLALAGTCRYFRTRYRDDVFQALCQVAFPEPVRYGRWVRIGLADGQPKMPELDTDGYVLAINRRSWNTENYLLNLSGSRNLVHGPFERSLSCARHIFSSDRSLVGAGGWDGWGLLPDEYEANRLVAEQQKEVIEAQLQVGWTHHQEGYVWPGEDQVAFESWLAIPDVETEFMNGSGRGPGERYERTMHFQRQLDQTESIRDTFGLKRIPGEDLAERNLNTYYWYQLPAVETKHDPWPSLWRTTVAQAVNNPVVKKGEAKSFYKLTERELLSLTPRTWEGCPKNATFYRKAAVEALALRKLAAKRQ